MYGPDVPRQNALLTSPLTSPRIARLIRGGGLMACLVLASLVPLEANAQDRVRVKDAQFATTLTEPPGYRLVGAGLFTYMIWDAYAGAYYQANGYPRPAPQSSVPRKLVLHYFHAIDAADFADVTEDTLRDQVGARDFPTIAAALRTFNASYRDVAPGDRYSLTWDGQQLTLTLNDEVLYRAPEAALASAMFGIWLGDEPLSREFRDNLLGRG